MIDNNRHPQALVPLKEQPFVWEYRPFVDHKRHAGFTVVELLITLVVAGILFGFAIPSMQTAIQNSRVRTQTNDLLADLNLARSEAMKRGLDVVICRSNTPTAQPPTCSTDAPAKWENGRVVFADTDGDGAPDLAEVLRVREPAPGTLTLRASEAALEVSITYRRSGQTTLASSPHLRVCDDRGAGQARGVVIEATGRARVVRTNQLPGGLTCP